MTVQEVRNYREFKTENFFENKTQLAMTYEYLDKYGSITPLEALYGYGCLRLAAYICILRKKNVAIDTLMVESDNGKTYAKYILRKEN